MFRVLPYIALFLTALISQLFIFDSLAASVLVAPLVYIIFIILLPIENSQILMLSMGVLLGVVMDASMGTEGLNSIATISVAFFRAPIIRLMIGRERSVDRGTPSALLFGRGNYLLYLFLMIFAHHAIFFAFESLSTSLALYTVVRLLASSSVTMLFVWLLANLFIHNKILK